jgi:hypothetical protein
VDFAQLVKVYASPREGEQRYSPGEVVDSVPEEFMGNPDSDRIRTSHIERQNLGIRMGMRRMTRLSNAAENGRICKPRIHCGLRITTSAGFTRRSGSLLRWKRESQITFGKSPK